MANEMKLWRCECGNEVIAAQYPQMNWKWTDGHTCNFVEVAWEGEPDSDDYDYSTQKNFD